VFGTIDVIRTRDAALLANCDLVVDVGAECDNVRTFDHHQKGGAGCRPNGIPFSGAGLVWRKFGVDACGLEGLAVAAKVDEELVQYIDASDNGHSLVEPKTPGLTGYSISAAVSSFNPGWDEDQGADFIDTAFWRAVDFIDTVLGREISCARGVIKAKSVVEAAIAKATDPRIIVLDNFAPWGEVVVPQAPLAQYVVFPSQKGEWMCQCVPDVLGSFNKRKALPKEWGGLRGADLSALTGVADAIFCHIGLFICGSATKEGAIKLASLAVEAEAK